MSQLPDALNGSGLPGGLDRTELPWPSIDDPVADRMPARAGAVHGVPVAPDLALQEREPLARSAPSDGSPATGHPVGRAANAPAGAGPASADPATTTFPAPDIVDRRRWLLAGAVLTAFVVLLAVGWVAWQTSEPDAAPPPANSRPAPSPVALPAPVPPVEAAADASRPAPGANREAPLPRIIRPLAGPGTAESVAAPTAAGSAPAAVPGPKIRVARAAATATADVEGAYAALERGDVPEARSAYLRALAADRSNRDALLGLGVVALRDANLAEARQWFARALELDSRDAFALAALASLRSPADPVSGESRLKTLIAQQADSGPASFALGNQLAAQGRWPEAQQCWFDAWRSDPANPDYAFNLAVGLDRIRQRAQALHYYRRALELAQSRAAAFPADAARARAETLAPAGEAASGPR